MFTEGLDEVAISWVKQGSHVDQKPRSPLAEKIPLGPIPPDAPSLCNRNSYLSSSSALPPLKLYSSFLGPIPSLNLDFNDDDDDDDKESIASAPSGVNFSYSDSVDEECLASSDSDLLENPTGRNGEEEVINSYVTSGEEAASEKNSTHRPTLVRGPSWENLKIEVPVNARGLMFRDMGASGSSAGTSFSWNNPHNHDQIGNLSSRLFLGPFRGHWYPKRSPIMENGREELRISEDERKATIPGIDGRDWTLPTDGRETMGMEQESDGVEARREKETISSELKPQLKNIDDPWTTLPSYHSSNHNAWQTFVAYDACFRLCLNAWARDCLEAPQFLQDECFLLRNAFGLQRFLLQPRGQALRDGRSFDSPKETSGVKEKKVVGKIKVEVKKVRMVPQRKLHGEYSPGALLVKSGAEYVRQASALLRTQINSLKTASYPVAQEDSLYCLLSLRSSTEEAHEDKAPAVCSQPGSGDSHILNQGDAILVEVQNLNKATQGRAIIPVSSLTENLCDRPQWWPIYRDDNECVGKVQLSVSCFSTYGGMNSIKGGTVVETVVYDSVLEAAMRAQPVLPRNLHIEGAWKWLLNEFADYYGVSDAYTKLRYVSYIMNMATPTKDCLELLHELLLPVVKARHENSLNRQEKSLLLECEAQVENLLATTFKNYKSLDDLSPTGLADTSVQLYTLLHDILSQEGQSMLRKYLQMAAAKRCRWLMVETDEFVLGNSEGLVTDPITISTAYLKMKALCISIRSEIEVDIRIHNQHILPRSSEYSASLYSPELCKRLRAFLATCPPSKPAPHVTELLSASADFERDLQSWNIPPAQSGVVSKDLFHDYIMVWIQETRLHLLEQCRSEKLPWSGALTNYSTSPFVENMYEQVKGTLIEYEVVIKRWPQYLLHLEAAVADVERTIMKTLEKQYAEILAPLRESFPKLLEKHVQKLTGRQSAAIYFVPDQLGTFLNTVKRILDTLHGKVEQLLRSWEPVLTVIGDGKSAFGEQMNGITVLLRKKFKNYVQAIVEKLVGNTKAARATRLKRVLEETRDSDGEAEVRERLLPLCLLLTDSIRNLHGCLSSRIFVTVCRGLWDRMGQIVLGFLESRKENRVWYRASDRALSVLDDFFASQMQTFQGNSLQEKDLDPPRSVMEARSILR
ncbi:unnamed protein product [Spirodela intermedia]|uniref:Uncharacterized protein n=1 Tax=Spirodela intermedia TaxID=51605 RepID=A0A7I8JKL2_SPIIN|nr:unnamed protein product [Spirodela intermedia]CAA6670133.1 unnamed protein product [Spirodela intermedia]